MMTELEIMEMKDWAEQQRAKGLDDAIPMTDVQRADLMVWIRDNWTEVQKKTSGID